MNFDASIDQVDAILPGSARMSDTVAADRVRAAVERMPGAGWTSVAACPGVPSGSEWIRVYRPGCAEIMGGGEWPDIAGKVESAVRLALS
jgi:hypothetical protein